jgi:hypothetical protein
LNVTVRFVALNVAVAELDDAVTVPELCVVTTLPLLSSTFTTGWEEKTVPSVALVLGCVVRTIFDALPAVRLKVFEVTESAGEVIVNLNA